MPSIGFFIGDGEREDIIHDFRANVDREDETDRTEPLRSGVPPSPAALVVGADPSVLHLDEPLDLDIGSLEVLAACVDFRLCRPLCSSDPYNPPTRSLSEGLFCAILAGLARRVSDGNCSMVVFPDSTVVSSLIFWEARCGKLAERTM